MRVTYASHHRWTKPVVADPVALFGKNAQANMRSALKKIDTDAVRTEIRELDEAFLDWFVPLYAGHIGRKVNPKIFDIREETLGKKEHWGEKKYYSLTLTERGERLGGTIFSVVDTYFAVAYRAYADRWRHGKLRANPSLYAEYVACTHAYGLGMETISHGRDRNPYGPNANIGLAIFKLSVGCEPRKSGKYEMHALETDALTEDALILEYPGDGTDLITRAHLVTLRENEPYYAQATKYPERLAVTIHYRNEVLTI